MSESVPRNRINDDGSREIHMVVLGTPEPQGSMRNFTIKRTGQTVTTSDNKRMKPWRQQVGWIAREAMKGLPMFEREPVSLHVNFIFAPPKKLKKGQWAKTTRPDVDKLARAILDSLTGIVYRDDSQVISLDVHKMYDAPPRAEIALLIDNASSPRA
jgi:Holliday junction resolvase RusA-like endonuclease